ncbi:MAG TPA: DUF4258 domain-containing protein [Blastocatellia bacterium]|nr:DUF4258 domain-containing protein [Blastocatellia bacterium]
MEAMDIRISKHASRRMAQRNLPPGDVETVIRYGHMEHRTGAEFYFLGKRDLPRGLERRLEHLVGATVVVCRDEVVTIYRNRRGLAEIKRKRYHPCARPSRLRAAANKCIHSERTRRSLRNAAG